MRYVFLQGKYNKKVSSSLISIANLIYFEQKDKNIWNECISFFDSTCDSTQSLQMHEFYTCTCNSCFSFNHYYAKKNIYGF